jgi:hypothetical protein
MWRVRKWRHGKWRHRNWRHKTESGSLPLGCDLNCSRCVVLQWIIGFQNIIGFTFITLWVLLLLRLRRHISICQRRRRRLISLWSNEGEPYYILKTNNPVFLGVPDGYDPDHFMPWVHPFTSVIAWPTGHYSVSIAAAAATTEAAAVYIPLSAAKAPHSPRSAVI